MLNETGQINAALLISISIPLILIILRFLREKKSIAVTVKIIKIEKIKVKYNIFYYLTFEVVDGPHKGKKYQSEWYYNHKSHKVGEYIHANIFPDTGEIYANKRSFYNWQPWLIPFIFIFYFIILQQYITPSI